MKNLFHAVLGSFNGPPIMYVMLVPIMVIVIFAIIVVINMALKNQERERWHETARLAIQKGVPLPPMPEDAQAVDVPRSRHKQRMGLITSGLVNIGVGFGVFLGLSHIDGVGGVRFWGLIPSLIGIALVLAAVIDILLSRNLQDRGDA